MSCHFIRNVVNGQNWAKMSILFFFVSFASSKLWVGITFELSPADWNVLTLKSSKVKGNSIYIPFLVCCLYLLLL